VGQQICRDICPVQQECLTYALRADIYHGTWGGMTEAERRALRRSGRHRTIIAGPVTLYDGTRHTEVREYRMVVVIAKAKFVPHLAPGEVGEVEDPLARVAVRNGYAELVGEVQNFDEWMYHGAELIVAGRTARANEATPKKSRAKKPQTDMVAPTTSAGESA
jgi:hypothetical protein